MKIIECEECNVSFQDSFMWWSGYFWFCFPCASTYCDEQEEEDLCSCHDGEIDIICRSCF
jgi:hypothetical protein